MINKKSYKSYFFDPLWSNNQILIAILGICSALAVTTTVQTAITMGLAVSIVTGCSSFFVSLLRKFTPDSVRMITQLIIISLFVIVIDQFLKAFFFDISKTLSVFVGLIITNCIVMGRSESLARHVPPIPAFLDGLASGLGYGWVLLLIGIIRELFGFGTLMGLRIIPQFVYASEFHPDGYQNLSLMVLAPSAFFLLGIMIWLVNIRDSKKEKR
ncbi:Na()-translocating NADH-quinone reductase subunit D,Na()-translocating NADH-quinone reductase subunit D,Na -transporting NADH:ubiquinone oxidoreductase, subunit NqrD,NADH:ubiquinone oxidoreductase, Na()-translocating, D subunit,Rnf-Nqr subunit, membrane protein [Chlamydia serpentis]|uniref:Na(+)-translocating NADH-quinone reductase subunit D n=1 Tax=Chlamydia serpentis TaxID=1967782 RepID=A0A2R8FAZ0_9CHLA|nr:NADH:ubiquinone reductase (Na(+)-transporting) subunit D [Chlamydia serpentis]SPN73564.1 Na()-translocating NADH-quinone reductase subunit D,Na()-translocating NADH-quinone reductase subunit D,Na -transporting NADH:ubiquinone oxidoreductase, subunit NqrD,NADH:ubiquinone oxidoreductase, Na()-translocating, D subunit,Rnf-Nqr subunit, membrane protein [Chlamydia serpentis]